MAAWLDDKMVSAGEVIAHVNRLRRDGWSVQAIADEAGVTRSLISNTLQRAHEAPRMSAGFAAAILTVHGPPPEGRRLTGGLLVGAALFDREQAATRWLEDAACRGMDPNLFHPGRGEGQEQIRAVCAGCPVRQRCLEHALAAGEKHGIWGGRSERERRRMRRGDTEPLAIDYAPPPDTGVVVNLDAHRPTPCPVCEQPATSPDEPCSEACDERAWARRLLGDPISDREYQHAHPTRIEGTP